MQIKTNGQRNITLDFEAPRKFKLSKDGVEVPYIRTGKNSFRLSKGVDGVLDLEEIQEQPKIVKPIQLQAQQMALVNPNDVLLINQAAQQLEIEQNLLSETQKRFENVQNYVDIQQQRINESIQAVNTLETDNYERITVAENSIFNLAGELARAEQDTKDRDNYVLSEIEAHETAENPHRITKKTIGLEKVDNTSDLDKPISKAVQSALDEKADKDEIEAIRDELGQYQEKNDRFTNALSNYTGGLGGNELPSGGLSGQVLVKKTDQTGDVEWADAVVTIDDELSTTSENPVQNKVITSALNLKADISDINDGVLTIQKNGSNIDTFTANSSTDKTINITVPTTASDINALPDSTTINDLTTSAQQAALNSGATQANITQIGTNTTNIATIEGKIPSQASASNQLADKAFVNSSIQTNTADFDGSWATYAAIPSTVGGFTSEGLPEPSNNNYLVVEQDETQDGGTWRYKYVDDGTAYNKNKWKVEYEINETPMTAAQLAALNSGITSTLVGQITTNQGDILTINGQITTINTTLATKISKFSATNPTLTTSGGVCTWSIVNPLATNEVQAQIFRVSDGVQVMTEVDISASTIVVKFNSSANITAGVYRAVVQG